MNFSTVVHLPLVTQSLGKTEGNNYSNPYMDILQEK
jgi:hypothetical protein